MSVDLEEALDELFAAELDAFTPLRNAKVKELRKAGEGESADVVAALRKPTVPAWVINRLARTARKDVDALLDSGHRLREAQRKLLAGGDQKAFAAARTKHADAVRKLVTAAERVLAEERGTSTGAMVDRVRATLEAVSVTDEGRELLARGRLTEDGAPTGFEAVGSLGVAASGADDRRRRAEQMRALERDLQMAREEERALQDAARDAEAEAAEASRDAVRLAKKAERARARADKAQTGAADLAGRLAELRRAGAG